MNDDSNSENAPGRKPRKAIDPDQYHYHKRNHMVAIVTASELKPEQRALYQTVVDYCYARRGPLPNDDVWLAKIQNCDLRVWKRVKAELLSLNRIVVDEEMGVIFDERTIRELVGDEVFSAKQAERASHKGKGGGKKSPRTRRGPPKLTVIDGNVEPLSEQAANDLGATLSRTVSPTVSRTITDRPGPKSEPTEPDSNTYHQPDACLKRIQEKNNSQHRSVAAPAATLPLRGSGGGDLKKQRRIEALDALKRSSLNSTKGCDATESEPGAAPDPETPAPADRTARRA